MIFHPETNKKTENPVLTLPLRTSRTGDASEEVYAAVIYNRNVYHDGHIIVRPFKASTILLPTIFLPKLDLNASLLAACLAFTVSEY